MYKIKSVQLQYKSIEKLSNIKRIIQKILEEIITYTFLKKYFPPKLYPKMNLQKL